MNNTILAFTVLTVGLVAGLFYSWSISVMLGMKKLPDREFILSMQAMNRAIQNPLFFTCFFGALVLLCISCFQHYVMPFDINFAIVLVAALLYFIGVIGVTIAGNVPLNNMLENFDLLKSSNDQVSQMRVLFETKWNTLNNVRTICNVLAFILLIARLSLNLK